MNYLDFEPMHKHEYINDLWEFERSMMGPEELLSWAERGFKGYLEGLPEGDLKARYSGFTALIQLSEGMK